LKRCKSSAQNPVASKSKDIATVAETTQTKKKVLSKIKSNVGQTSVKGLVATKAQKENPEVQQLKVFEDDSEVDHVENSHNATSQDLSELHASSVQASKIIKTEAANETFKERIAQYKKQLSKQLIFSDSLDMRNPQMVAEMAPQIYNTMREQEIQFQVEPDYLSKVQLPTEVKDTSRAFLVEWIIDVHRKFRLLPETLYVTVFLIDRFLSLKQIKKSQLHILGVTSLLISTKYEEIYPPELKDLLSVSENKFSRAEVLAMERDMLSVLDFNMTHPSAYRFLERFKKLSSTANDDQVFYFAQYLQEISLLDASLLKYRPSEIAAASLILSAKNIKRVNAWNKEMEKATYLKEDHMNKVVEDVRSFALEVNPKFLTTLKYKFSKQEYLDVASIAFKF